MYEEEKQNRPTNLIKTELALENMFNLDSFMSNKLKPNYLPIQKTVKYLDSGLGLSETSSILKQKYCPLSGIPTL